MMEANNINETLSFTLEINGIKQDLIEPENCPESGEIETSLETFESSIQLELSPPEIGNIILNDEAEIEDVNAPLSENKYDIQTESSPPEICISRIKEEIEDVRELECTSCTEVGIELNAWDNNGNNIVARSPVSEICDIKSENIKLENDNINNNELHCNHSHEDYQSYCTTCNMLIHILDRNIVSNSARERLPRHIVEIRKILNSTGIFTLKLIPENVQFGPFTGVNTSNNVWKIKRGKLSSSVLHWMWHINSAKSVSEQNLLPFQYEGKLYYRTSRDIQVGEELLVYFGKEYINRMNKNIEMDFVPSTENNVRDVFACTYCCLGYSSRMYLMKHNAICSERIFGKSSTGEIRQCPLCKVYMEVREYRRYHLRYCLKQRIRKRLPPVGIGRVRKRGRASPESNAAKNRQRKMYNKCSRCEYKTKYKSELQRHTSQHYQVKLYDCSICRKRFSRKQNLKLHVISAHIDTGEIGKHECSTCGYKTFDKWCLNMHMRIKHKARKKRGLMQRNNRRIEDKEGGYNKEKLDRLKDSLYSRHEVALNEFKCAHCRYETYKKQYLTRHIAKCKYKRISADKKEIRKRRNGKAYACSKCDFETEYNSHLLRHQYTHGDVKPLQCSLCDYSTHREDSLKNHLNLVHEKAPRFTRSRCDYASHWKNHLKEHVHREHATQKRFKCAESKYESTREERFKKHAAVAHSEDKKSLACAECGYVAHSPAHLTRHRYTHDKSNKPLKCSKCDYAAHRTDRMKAHMSVHEEAKFQCDECEFRAKRQDALNRHVARVHRKLRKYKCRAYDCSSIDNLRKYADVDKPTDRRKPPKRNNFKCTYETINITQLKRHIQSKHYEGTPAKDHKCPKCDYATSYKFDLKLHLPIHDEEKKYQCHLCDFKTHRKGIFTQHFKNKHRAERGFQCPECEYSTTNGYYLKLHVESKHREGHRRYKCTMCDFESAYRDSLKQHLGIHETVKQYKCSECPYETNAKKKFDVHVRVKHGEGKQFKCAKCDFRTGYKDSLKAHIGLHDNVKEFKCASCDFETRYKKSLRQHIDRKHSLEKKKKKKKKK